MINAALRVDLDLRKLRRRVLTKRRRVLFRAAGFTRQVMRRRIRTAKGTSRPGQAPKGKTRRLKAGVRFDVDANAGVADVGFVAFRSDQAKPLGGKTVPQVINAGGRERLDQPARLIAVRSTGRDASGRFTGDTKTVQKPARTRIARYEPRPIVDPVERPAEEKLRQLMRDVPL